MKNKPLKKWNGRGAGEYVKGQFFIAAYSQKQAAALHSKAAYPNRNDILTTPWEIQQYFSPCWGNDTKLVDPVEPCVYAIKRYGETPERIV